MRATETFAEARRADLPALWSATGHGLQRSGYRLVSCFCPACGESKRPDKVSLSKQDGIWRWRCYACEQGGSTVDFVVRLEKIDPLDAARKIVGGTMPQKAVKAARRIEERAINPADPEVSKAFVASIEAMRKHGLNPAVMDYLAGRGIREETAVRAHASGLLVTLPADPEEAVIWLEAKVGKALMMKAGLWSKRWPAAAYRPLIFCGPTSEVAELRSLERSEDSPKAIQFGRQDHPLLFKPRGEVKRIVTIEGGVDLMSLMDMGEDEHSLLVGMYGTGSWRELWARRIVKKYPKAEWLIATDADTDGHKCAARIAEHLSGLGAKHRRWEPFAGKDWNDALVAIAA
jgi:hypothetical protein